MTADERIEKLLNRFGQTISDLPKGRDYIHNDELWVHLKKTEAQAFDWLNAELLGEFDFFGLRAYICHLADVIDRMETALETALRCTKCSHCVHFYEQEWKDSECLWNDEKCSFRVANFDLVGFVEPEQVMEKEET